MWNTNVYIKLIYDQMDNETLYHCSMANKLFYKIFNSDAVWEPRCLKLRTMWLYDSLDDFNHLNSYKQRYQIIISLQKLWSHLFNIGVIHLDECDRLPDMPEREGDDITSLYHYKSLYLGNNCSQIAQLPDEIGILINLTFMSVNVGKIRTIPSSIGNLTNLIRLDLIELKIKELPASMCNMLNLEELNLQNNRLVNLPAEFNQMKKLTHIDLSNNDFTKIPNCLFELTNLSILNMEKNCLRKISPKIGKLVNLTNLDISSNRLTTLPCELNNLKKLPYVNTTLNYEYLKWDDGYELDI